MAQSLIDSHKHTDTHKKGVREREGERGGKEREGRREREGERETEHKHLICELQSYLLLINALNDSIEHH